MTTMRSHAKGRVDKRAAILASVACAVGGCMLFGCANAASQGDGGSAESSLPAEAATSAEWGEAYPLQYASAKASVNERDGVNHGHYGITERIFAPLARESTGATSTNLAKTDDGYYMISGFHYDADSGQWVIDEGELSMAVQETRVRQGCFDCKSSVFGDYYESEGAEAYAKTLDEEFVSQTIDEVWDCGLCHSDPSNPSEYDSVGILFERLSGGVQESFDEGDRVCGQCHNVPGGSYRAKITSEADLDAYRPYRYGIDADAVLQAFIEDGIATVDEASGAIAASASHPDVEIFQGSNHESLGLTCVDCHMVETTDEESGQTYTNHNASSSPLENEAALEYCLTCHKDQGIESTEAMVEMVRGRQSESEQLASQVRDKLATLYDKLVEATSTGAYDEQALAAARDSYTKAYWYDTWAEGKVGVGVTGDAEVHDGGKVVHDPREIDDLLNRANTLLDEALGSLA